VSAVYIGPQFQDSDTDGSLL